MPSKLAKNNFWIYYNWTARRDIGIIHVSSCGHCRSGRGKHKNVRQGINGHWIGPFTTLREAERYEDIPEKRHCRCIGKING